MTTTFQPFRRRFRGFPAIVAVLLATTGSSSVVAADAPPTVRWDPESLRLIEAKGDYARIASDADGREYCVYDRGGRLYLRSSRDGGSTWEDPILVAEDRDCVLTNAEILPMRSGSLLYFWNARPREALREAGKDSQGASRSREKRLPFTIQVARSEDHGRSWSPPQILHSAGTSFRDGCWEPAPIELPSGEIQVYFADESKFTQSNEQEIAVVRSGDGGASWGRAERFAFRPRHRDGMPVPVQLVDGRVAVAIEDDGASGERFKPSILVRDLGEGAPRSIGGDDPRRREALRGVLDPSWYAGAPYLRRAPSGEVLLSFQEDRSGSMKDCRMVVCVGDATASTFGEASRPFPDEPGSNQLWNSLFVRDDGVVTALSTATFQGVRGIWAVEGRIEKAADAGR